MEEILEACAVAISLGGTMGAGETTPVVRFLEEKGLLTGEALKPKLFQRAPIR